MKNLSGNRVSKVWRDGDWIYKRQPKFLTDNEIWCYQQMWDTGFVPYAERLEDELIRVEYIERTAITDPSKFGFTCTQFLVTLVEVGIRHGDLTRPHIIPNNNRLYVIDWAESRLRSDPRPDKRREGDRYWLSKTREELLDEKH